MFDSLGSSSSSSCSYMNGLHFLPPGYRFHPTDEELVKYYLTNKVSPLEDGHCRGSFSAIAEVDLNKCEPWDLPDQAKIGEKEWYFYSLRDRKYPTGLRTNRATEAGYWKATGKDRLISNSENGHLIGMKKTLVFYIGRAPKGEKTHWIMHEYRLSSQHKSPIMSLLSKEEWVICRVFKKNHSSSGSTNNLTDDLITRHNPCLTNASEINTTGCLPSLLDSPNTMAEEVHHPKQEQDYASTNQIWQFKHPSQSSSTLSSFMLNYPANQGLNLPTNSANPYSSTPSINVLKALLDHYSSSVSADPKIEYPISVNTVHNPWSEVAPTQMNAHAPVNLSLNQMESGFLGGDITSTIRAMEYNQLEEYGLY